MAAVTGKDTTPEMRVRRLAHHMGYRYRLHVAELPGRPDLVFPGRRKIIEVRGCFWHRHLGCKRTANPRTRTIFWERKFRDTVARDARNLAMLEQSGWRVLVVWECETTAPELSTRLRLFLDPHLD